MNPLSLLALAAVALLPSAARTASETSVDQAVGALTQAIVANDVDAIEPWLSPDWSIVDGSGVIVDRARFLAAIRSGELVHDAMVIEAGVVRRIGDDSRLWIGRARGGGRYQGAPFTFDERSTSVWIWRHGHWICLFTQLTSIARPG